MLFNTEKLRGMPKKIKALAKREAQVSLVQQVYPKTGAPLSMQALPRCQWCQTLPYTCSKLLCKAPACTKQRSTAFTQCTHLHIQ